MLIDQSKIICVVIVFILIFLFFVHVHYYKVQCQKLQRADSSTLSNLSDFVPDPRDNMYNLPDVRSYNLFDDPSRNLITAGNWTNNFQDLLIRPLKYVINKHAFANLTEELFYYSAKLTKLILIKDHLKMTLVCEKLNNDSVLTSDNIYKELIEIKPEFKPLVQSKNLTENLEELIVKKINEHVSKSYQYVKEQSNTVLHTILLYKKFLKYKQKIENSLRAICFKNIDLGLLLVNLKRAAILYLLQNQELSKFDLRNQLCPQMRKNEFGGYLESLNISLLTRINSLSLTLPTPIYKQLVTVENELNDNEDYFLGNSSKLLKDGSNNVKEEEEKTNNINNNVKEKTNKRTEEESYTEFKVKDLYSEFFNLTQFQNETTSVSIDKVVSVQFKKDIKNFTNYESEEVIMNVYDISDIYKWKLKNTEVTGQTPADPISLLYHLFEFNETKSRNDVMYTFLRCLSNLSTSTSTKYEKKNELEKVSTHFMGMYSIYYHSKKKKPFYAQNKLQIQPLLEELRKYFSDINNANIFDLTKEIKGNLHKTESNFKFDFETELSWDNIKDQNEYFEPNLVQKVKALVQSKIKDEARNEIKDKTQDKMQDKMQDIEKTLISETQSKYTTQVQANRRNDILDNIRAKILENM
jgi:hypothetical protein